jgi:hypothetical protein
MKLPEENRLCFLEMCQRAGAASKDDHAHLLERRPRREAPLHHATKQLVVTHIEQATTRRSKKRRIDAPALRKFLLLNSRHGPAGDSSMIVYATVAFIRG